MDSGRVRVSGAPHTAGQSRDSEATVVILSVLDTRLYRSLHTYTYSSVCT